MKDDTAFPSLLWGNTIAVTVHVFVYFINHCTPFRSIYFKEKVAPLTAPLQQLVSGLETYGILGMMKQNKEEFKSIFVKNDLLTWSVEAFHDLKEPEYSSSGSFSKALEINTMKAFVNVTESVFYEGTFNCRFLVISFVWTSQVYVAILL